METLPYKCLLHCRYPPAEVYICYDWWKLLLSLLSLMMWYIPGLILGIVQSMSLEKTIMTCIYCCSIIQCNFTAPKSLYSICSSCLPLAKLIFLMSPSFQFTRSIMSNSLWPNGMQHARIPCPQPTARSCPNSCPLRWWCHLAISSFVFPFSCLQSSQFIASGSKSIGGAATASVLPKNIQDWFPLGFPGLIFLQSKELSRVFSNTTVQKHQFFTTEVSLWSDSHIHTWLLEKP